MEPNGQTDPVAANLAQADANVTYAQVQFDTARRTLQLAEAELIRATAERQTLRDYYHAVRTPSRQHSAITR